MKLHFIRKKQSSFLFDHESNVIHNPRKASKIWKYSYLSKRPFYLKKKKYYLITTYRTKRKPSYRYTNRIQSNIGPSKETLDIMELLYNKNHLN